MDALAADVLCITPPPTAKDFAICRLEKLQRLRNDPVQLRKASAIAKLCCRSMGSAERPVIAAMAENMAADAMPNTKMVITSSTRVIPRCAGLYSRRANRGMLTAWSQ